MSTARLAARVVIKKLHTLSSIPGSFGQRDFTALVDCGGTDRPGSAVADILEAYGWGGLDAVVLTHYHEDHAPGEPSPAP